MKLIIEDGEGQERGVPVGRDEISIGREAGNTVQLPERNVSRRHARLRRKGGALWLEDLDSSNGVRVNGARIYAPTPVLPGDLIQIGDYDLGLEGIADHSDDAEAFASETAVIRAEDVRAATSAAPARDLPSSEAPRLVCLSGPLRGREYPLRRSIAPVGRSADNVVQIDHPSMSRRHCRLELAGGEWKIFDESSANGVRVNGEPYAAATLRSGDVLELGHVRLRFCPPGEAFALPAARSGARVRAAVLVGAGLAAIVAGALLGRANRTPPAPASERRAANAAGPAAAQIPAPAAQAPSPVAGPTAQAPSPLAGPAALAPSPGPAAAPPPAASARTAAAAGGAPASTPPSRSAPVAAAPARAAAAEGGRPTPAPSAGRPKLAAARDARAAAAAGPSQAARDAAASRSIEEGNARVQAGDYDGAIASFSAAVDQKPAQPILALAWRGLGVAYVYAGDAKNGVRYFKLYQPFCPASERAQLDQTIARYGG